MPRKSVLKFLTLNNVEQITTKALPNMMDSNAIYLDAHRDMWIHEIFDFGHDDNCGSYDGLSMDAMFPERFFK